MSVSLPVTPLHAPSHLEIDMSGSASRPLERGLHDSPASFASSGDPHLQQEQPGRAPFDPASHLSTFQGTSDAGSFIDRGALVEPVAPSSSSPHSTLSSTQRIFSQLDTVKAIQARIAYSHSVLERIPAIDTLAAAEQPPVPVGASSSSSSSPPPAGTGKPGRDGGLGDRTKEQRERVAKAYEDSADQFARREEGVESIMAQLGELSAALKTLHSLPSPSLFPRSPTSPSSSSPQPTPTTPSAPAKLVPPPTKSDTDPVGAQDERDRRLEALRAQARPARARTARAHEA
ncbi:hypothetical protein JCM8208_000384 [Rhodotorula glutinis]